MRAVLLPLMALGCRLPLQPLARVFPEPVVERVLLESEAGRPVVARTYPGQSEEVVLVIAGVHGSERSGIELCASVEGLLEDMDPRPRTTVVVPVLFPDLAVAGQREDPRNPTNRNFPPPGQGPRLGEGGQLLDAMGRRVLPANAVLMELMAAYKPDRVLSLHATWRVEAAGIFAGSGPMAPRTTQASELALRMAQWLAERGQYELVVGNALDGTPHTSWSGAISGGVSLGGWGPVAINESGPWDRPDAMILTVELPGYEGANGDPERQARFDHMAAAIVEVGLR